MGAIDALWTPLGRWRTDFLWRLFGFCLIDNGVYQLTQPAGAGDDWLVHGLTLCGVALCVFGARLLVIGLTAAVTLACFGLVLSDRSHTFFFPAAEWTIFLALPCFTLFLSALALAEHARANSAEPPAPALTALDGSVVALFRAMVVVALASAALHKLNRDFFDLSVSCIDLERRLVEWWQLPGIFASLSPIAIVIAEGTAPILLMFAPLIGIPATILLVAAFMSIGAPPFAALVVSMAMAFLPDQAGPAVLGALRKRWPVIALAATAIVAAAGSRYRGDFPWSPIALAQAFTLSMLCVAGIAIADHWKRKRSPEPSAAAAPAPAPSPALRASFAVLVALLVFNSLTPYLGLKFQYSFAMLSNLRVDDDRWNSLIFPRSMRLTEHDPFVHITRVRYTKLATGDVIDGGGILPPALYAPSVVMLRVQRALERGVKTTFDFSYLGKQYSFAEAQDPSALYALVQSWPSTPLFQKVLDAAQPQSCQH